MSKSTMKAAQVVEFKQPYALNDVPIPTPGPGELLIQVGAAGFCHTDMLVKDGIFAWAGTKLPITGSHEGVGTVRALGSGVDGFQEGDRVGATNLLHPCKACPDCKNATPQYCSSKAGVAGISRDGAFAEYMLVDAEFSAKLPDGLSFVQAAPLMCAGGTIYAAIQKCGLKEGDLIGIVGLGALGHLGVQFAKTMGYKVAAIDARQEPLDLVQAADFPYHPDAVLNPTVDTDDADILRTLTGALGTSRDGYEGLDAVVVTADSIAAYHYAVRLLHKHGLLVAVSQPEPMIEIKDRSLIFKDITVKGALLPHGRAVLGDMLGLADETGIRSSVRTYRLEEVNQMVEDFHRPDMKGKFVVEF